MKKTLMRIFALALAMLALLSSAHAASLFDFGNGIPESSFRDDGVIRVLLKSLGAPGNLTLTLNGLYTVEHDAGFRFDRNSKIVLSAGEDCIWLSAGGMKIDMGSSLTLTRHASDSPENGIRIAETERDTIYEGDLTVSLDDNGSLRCVLSIFIEDYLCGVIAYEMSDSWPIEALKSQAVAARTYAMQRKYNAGSRDYDLVDTTADQVFRGYNADYTHVEEAVNATRGIVGTYKGGFATCYYTASNGGQTALPVDVWMDEDDYGYLACVEDPYDLENRLSVVNSVTFTPGAQDNPVLHAMLTEGLLAAAEEAGVSTDGMELCQILSIEPVNPAVEGSLRYKTLRFTVSALANRPAMLKSESDIGAPAAKTGVESADAALSTIDVLRRMLENSPYVPGMKKQLIDETFAVDLDVYTDIKDKLGLSINSADYEMVSVKEGIFEYTIEMRRFGHGVGMSQRGAQNMAGMHNKTWKEIITFYFPGMTLEEISWDEPVLTPIEALPDSIGAARPDPTPAPSPAPLPPLQEGQYYAAVSLGDASSSMNVRKEPTTNSQAIAHLSCGEKVIVASEADADGWVQIKTAEFTGYCKLEYLKQE